MNVCDMNIKMVYMFVSENNYVANSINYVDTLTTQKLLSNLICISQNKLLS